jgi:hypothetical protein
MRRKKYQELARLAQLEARTRGHDLGAWTWGGMWTPGRSVSGRVTGSAKCMDCKAEAQIVSWPDPDETEIGGPATDTACQKGQP